MLSQYILIQKGIDVCNIFNLPKELKNYEVEVIIKPIIIKSKKKSFSNFKESIQKYSFDLPNNFKFNRDEIYGYLDE